MTEKIQINGTDIWIVVDPHIEHTAENASEYFTASYFPVDPIVNPAGILFVDNDQKAVRFSSPVAALEFANEKLLDII